MGSSLFSNTSVSVWLFGTKTVQFKLIAREAKETKWKTKRL